MLFRSKERANSSIAWNKFRNLQTMFAVQTYLKQLGVPTIQTYMDDLLFDQTYHAPDYIKTLQSLVYPELTNFDGQNFLEWSRSKGYEVTPAPGDHPLEEAHIAASVLWQDRYSQALGL